jgi:hypothetical protein
VREGGRAGVRRGVPTVTVTSGFFSSGFSPSDPGAVGRGARTGSRVGAEMGSAPPAPSEALTAAQTRPFGPDVIAVTSVFAESNIVVTFPARSTLRTSPDPDVPAQTDPSAAECTVRTCGSAAACTRSPRPDASMRWISPGSPVATYSVGPENASDHTYCAFVS